MAEKFPELTVQLSDQEETSVGPDMLGNDFHRSLERSVKGLTCVLCASVFARGEKREGIRIDVQIKKQNKSETSIGRRRKRRRWQIVQLNLCIMLISTGTPQIIFGCSCDGFKNSELRMTLEQQGSKSRCCD